MSQPSPKGAKKKPSNICGSPQGKKGKSCTGIGWAELREKSRGMKAKKDSHQQNTIGGGVARRQLDIKNGQL